MSSTDHNTFVGGNSAVTTTDTGTGTGTNTDTDTDTDTGTNNGGQTKTRGTTNNSVLEKQTAGSTSSSSGADCSIIQKNHPKKSSRKKKQSTKSSSSLSSLSSLSSPTTTVVNDNNNNSKSKSRTRNKTTANPITHHPRIATTTLNAGAGAGAGVGNNIFTVSAMMAPPKRNVLDWSTVSKEYGIYVVDVGMTPSQCDDIVTTTEQACQGQYAAYTYAKQTLGCREYPTLATASFDPVHTMVDAITHKFGGISTRSTTGTGTGTSTTTSTCNSSPPCPCHHAAATATAATTATTTAATDVVTTEDCITSNAKTNATTNANINANATMNQPSDVVDRNNNQVPKCEECNCTMGNNNNDVVVLQLDDREPHIVKYDVTKKERQKLDMHTDKSAWTFLIALSNGCGLDYEGGGTYFDCLDATVHIQRGHALVFPGKLRHRGVAITTGLRFLLVGFLVDKNQPNKKKNQKNNNKLATKDSSTAA